MFERHHQDRQNFHRGGWNATPGNIVQKSSRKIISVLALMPEIAHKVAPSIAETAALDKELYGNSPAGEEPSDKTTLQRLPAVFVYKYSYHSF
ncbi:MAG: hypothetical protein LZF85_09435 [Nitrosomonas sp.]|uniref:hypothetical protein n=1 Tax=Nitrosomonas sp. TaxID=42353 RepID=UPI0025FD671E|nr:hypothetical protein [Nitrosomonas sp.]UJP02004.1 MAG: hypothetical protein LZF85_09435 [Nitrosomonas sp.]